VPTRKNETVSAKRYGKALAILDAYRQRLVDQATREILDAETEMDGPFTGKGDPLVEHYGSLLNLVRIVMCEIAKCIPSDPPKVHSEVLACPLEGIAARLDAWFKEHEGDQLDSMQIVPWRPTDVADAECKLLVVYRSTKDPDPGQTA